MGDDVSNAIRAFTGDFNQSFARDPKKERDIAPIDEFLSDPYYTGSVNSVIYPFWREKIIEFMNSDDKYEAVIDGSTSSGKTWSSVLCLFYKFYVLSCFKYPQRLFGMSDETNLGFYYFNVKQKIAKNTGYQDLRGFFNESRYFQEEVNWDKRKRNSIELQDKNLVASFGANESDIKGINLLGIVLDETNFFKKSGSSSKADLQKVRNIYTDAIDRITQRFHSEGYNPGLAMVISSATEDDSFIEERKKASGEHMFYVKAVKHKLENKYKDRFWVFGGTEAVDPCILKSVDHLKSVLDDVDLNFDLNELDNAESLEEAVELVPTDIKDRFDNPPEDWRDRYEYDIKSALQNRSGIPTGRQGKLFTNKEKWNQCEERRPFPFHSKNPTISTEGAKNLDSYFKKEVLCEKRKIADDIHEWIPRVNPGAVRYLYSDLSATTDPSGIAMVHVEDIGEEDGSGMSYPYIYVDFMLQILPPEAPARLDHDKIINFVGLLKNKYQFDIKTFGTDSYAGETVCQRLNKNLFDREEEEAKVLSMDQNDKPWIEFTRLLYKGFIRFGNYDIFRKEFMNLDHERADGKVDHPDEFPDGSVGTKDVSDSVVGATTLAMSDEDVKAGQFPDSADEILSDEGSELVDDYGNVDIGAWRGRNDEMPFKSKDEVIEDQRDEDIIDLL